MSPLRDFSPGALRQYFQTQRARSAAHEKDPIPEGDDQSRSKTNASPFTALSEVQETQLRWLWPGMIPLGQITLLDGNPGVGKSTMMTDLAARASADFVMPDATTSDLQGPSGVLIVTTEDAAGSTIRNRAQSAGAEISRIFVLPELEQLLDPHFSEGRFTFPKDAPVLRDFIEKHNVKLCIFDPVLEYLSTGYDYCNASDVRKALASLQAIAAQCECAIVLLRHLNKSVGQAALQRGQGSMALPAVARSALLVASNPDYGDDSHFVVANSKSSNSKKSRSISYELTSDHTLNCGRIEWGEAVRFSAEELATQSHDRSENSSRREIAKLLLEITADGPIAIPVAQDMVRDCLGHFSAKTVRRAAIDAELVTLSSHSVPPLRYWGREGQSAPSLDSPKNQALSVQTEIAGNERQSAELGSSSDTGGDVSTLEVPALDIADPSESL